LTESTPSPIDGKFRCFYCEDTSSQDDFERIKHIDIELHHPTQEDLKSSGKIDRRKWNQRLERLFWILERGNGIDKRRGRTYYVYKKRGDFVCFPNYYSWI